MVGDGYDDVPDVEALLAEVRAKVGPVQFKNLLTEPHIVAEYVEHKQIVVTGNSLVGVLEEILHKHAAHDGDEDATGRIPVRKKPPQPPK